MKILSFVLFISVLVNSCQILNPKISSKPINMYPPKSIKIKFQQDWQYNLYHKRIIDFKKFPIGFKKIVFLGNSITEGARSWNKRLNQKNIVNRGISGDITEGVLERLGEIYYYKPLAVFILIGINDLFDTNIENGELINPSYVANNILNIARNIKSESTHTSIYIQTILPVNLDKYELVKNIELKREKDLNTQIIETNTILKTVELPMGIYIIDTHREFSDNNNNLNETYSSDGVHLNEKGYKVWTSLLSEEVDNINKKYSN